MIGGHDICHSSILIVKTGYCFYTQDRRVVIGGHDICIAVYLLLRVATASTQDNRSVIGGHDIHHRSKRILSELAKMVLLRPTV